MQDHCHKLFLTAAAAALACALLPRAASCAAAKEAEVKAAYIYNFTQFVEWEVPAASAAGHFDICVLGSDPVAGPLSALPEAEVRGKKLRVRLLGDSEEELRSCRILFLGKAKRGRARGLANALRGAGVLTVSDLPGFARGAGVIGFAAENNKIRIEINLRAAREAGLKISSRLLEVSRLVQDRP
ncbi:MAG: hypothetical protein A2X32_10515 [Elusimicrobia bacterium GWC2_64_44]|nr:MAG: hypothetical protein A2X32_10515 [Elusimicrobia bacterium GWC2_64_44]